VLFPNGIREQGRDIVPNLISLSRDSHNFWNKGLFALQPLSLSDDKKTLKIKFFWQAKHQDIKDRETEISVHTQPPSTEGLYYNSGREGECYLTTIKGTQGLATIKEAPLIKSGDIFTLTTDNPDKRPLPSFELLEMQFFLQRVSGMAGAARPFDFEWWNDYDATGAAANVWDVDMWENDSEVAESDVSDLELDKTDVPKSDIPESDMATGAEAKDVDEWHDDSNILESLPDLTFDETGDTSLISNESRVLGSPAQVRLRAAALPSAERPKHVGEAELREEGEGEEGLIQP